MVHGIEAQIIQQQNSIIKFRAMHENGERKKETYFIELSYTRYTLDKRQNKGYNGYN